MAESRVSADRTVHVVDDDAAVRRSLERLLDTAGFRVVSYDSSSAFLQTARGLSAGCVLLDIQMPGVDGLEVQSVLNRLRVPLSVIVMTAHGDVASAVQAMKAGAVDFLPKPFKPNDLLKCVDRALARSVKQRCRAAEKNNTRGMLDLLTPREFEVMQLVSTGLLNKQVAGELGIAEKTVKVHRGRVMEKLRVNSIAELVRLVEKAEVPPLARRS